MNESHFNRKKTLLSAILFLTATLTLNAQSMSTETFTVTQVPAENGSYTIQPKIASDGKVPAGTVLTVTAKASSGYRLMLFITL